MADEIDCDYAAVSNENGYDNGTFLLSKLDLIPTNEHHHAVNHNDEPSLTSSTSSPRKYLHRTKDILTIIIFCFCLMVFTIFLNEHMSNIIIYQKNKQEEETVITLGDAAAITTLRGMIPVVVFDCNDEGMANNTNCDNKNDLERQLELVRDNVNTTLMGLPKDNLYGIKYDDGLVRYRKEHENGTWYSYDFVFNLDFESKECSFVDLPIESKIYNYDQPQGILGVMDSDSGHLSVFKGHISWNWIKDGFAFFEYSYEPRSGLYTDWLSRPDNVCDRMNINVRFVWKEEVWLTTACNNGVSNYIELVSKFRLVEGYMWNQSDYYEYYDEKEADNSIINRVGEMRRWRCTECMAKRTF